MWLWLKMRVGIARICGERLHLSGCACAWMVKMTAYDRGHSNSFQCFGWRDFDYDTVYKSASFISIYVNIVDWKRHFFKFYFKRISATISFLHVSYVIYFFFGGWWTKDARYFELVNESMKAQAKTSSENITSLFCNHLSVIQIH